MQKKELYFLEEQKDNFEEVGTYEILSVVWQAYAAQGAEGIGP